MKVRDIITNEAIERLYRVRPLPPQYVRDAIDALAMEVIGESYVWPGHVWSGFTQAVAVDGDING